MTVVRLVDTFADWRKHARELLLSQVPPDAVIWRDDQAQESLAFNQADFLLTPKPDRASSGTDPIKVPASFVSLARKTAFHRDSEKWRLLYSVLWRIVHQNYHLLKIETDDEVARLLRMRDQVKQDEHHMHAFVRFRKIERDGNEIYVAWYKPDHKIIRLTAPFFRDRFAAMRWSILTPDESAHWDGVKLRFTPGVDRPPEDIPDAMEKLWNLYYKATFNPARVNVKLLKSHVPVRHWVQMPEMNAVAVSISDAGRKVNDMIAVESRLPGATKFIPASHHLADMREAVQACHGCELFQHATQAVFGEGPPHPEIVLVGEQPGDQEDRVGKPFVGPAGEVLDRALREAEIDRKHIYVTNVVKHFAFSERGKRRIHRTPRYSEIIACRPWLEAELQQLQPKVLVCLGATAAKAFFGSQFRLTEQRGKILPSKFCEQTLVTYHPSAVLRSEESSSGERLYQFLVEDLRLAREKI